MRITMEAWMAAMVIGWVLTKESLAGNNAKIESNLARVGIKQNE